MTTEDFDSERLKALTDQMVDAITSPPYVEAMRAVKAADGSRRLDEAMRRLTPDALRDQGVKLPDDMRISSRYFEEGFKPLEVGEVAGERNLLTELHAADPELINTIGGLRAENRPLYEEVIQRLTPRGLGPLALCGCACGGAAGVCAGSGGG